MSKEIEQNPFFQKIPYISEKERYHTNANQVLKYLMNDIGGISEGELSRRTGVPQPTIHRILSGITPNPRIKAIQPLADFFCVTSDQILARLPLPADRIPGTFNPIKQFNHKIPLFPIEALTNDSNAIPLKYINTDMPLSQSSYAVLLNISSNFSLLRSESILIIDCDKKPIIDSYVLVKKENLLPMIARFISEKQIVLEDSPGGSLMIALDNSITILGVIMEIRNILT